VDGVPVDVEVIEAYLEGERKKVGGDAERKKGKKGKGVVGGRVVRKERMERARDSKGRFV